MQPLHTQRSRHSNLSYPRANGWLLKDARPAHHHPYARYALFYFVLFAVEITLLGALLWSGATSTWPVWKVANIALVNLCFALLAGNHHISRNSQHLAANLVLAGFSLLVLVVLTAFVTPGASGLKILAYTWICVLLINALHYYPGRRSRARKRF